MGCLMPSCGSSPCPAPGMRVWPLQDLGKRVSCTTLCTIQQQLQHVGSVQQVEFAAWGVGGTDVV